MIERRKSSRIAVVGTDAKAICDRCLVIGGRVLNLSWSGACIEIANSSGIPDEIHLKIGKDGPRPCRVVWRAIDRLGLAFLGQPITSALTLP